MLHNGEIATGKHSWTMEARTSKFGKIDFLSEKSCCIRFRLIRLYHYTDQKNHIEMRHRLTVNTL